MTAPWTPTVAPSKVGDKVTFTDAAGVTYANVSVVAIGWAWVTITGHPIWAPATAVVIYTDATGASRTAALGFA